MFYLHDAAATFAGIARRFLSTTHGEIHRRHRIFTEHE